MSKAPGFVALPEVNEYSERIQVGELGQPVGFDIERLELHIGRTERLSRWADIGNLSIEGFRGDTTEYGYGVGGVSSQGIATAVRSAVITRAKTREARIEPLDKDLPPDYRWHSAKVWINNAEIEQRIGNDGDKWQRGAFDALARGKYMDQALRLGVADAAATTQLNGDVPGSLLKSMLVTAAGVITYSVFLQTDIETAAGLFMAVRLAKKLPIHALIRHAYAKHDVALPPRQWSLSPVRHYDRYMVAQGLARTTKLIRAR